MRGALGLAFLLIAIPVQGHDHSRCVVDDRDREVCLHNAARRIATLSPGATELEALVGLAPDLVIGWVTGNPAEQMETLEALGMPVFYIEPRSVEDVAHTIERLARLAGTEPTGRQAASEFRDGMAALTARYRERDPVPTFYQVWDEPLMSVNNEHLIGQVVELRAGRQPRGHYCWRNGGGEPPLAHPLGTVPQFSRRNGR